MTTTNQNLIDAIDFSPLLEEDQKELLIGAIRTGEPYPPELGQAILEFGRAVIEFEKIQGNFMKERVHELEQNIKKNDMQRPELSEEEIQKRAKMIIETINAFITESNRLQNEYDKKVETIIHEKAELSEADAIRAKLQQPINPDQ